MIEKQNYFTYIDNTSDDTNKTYKQTIIDGVDVSGCVRLQDNNISCELGGKCQGWDNCYYKQLKRAENQIVDLNKMVEVKEQECEELKEINSQLMKYRKHSATCQECYTDGLEDGKLYNKELHKYKQTEQKLEKIKEHLATVSYLAPFSTRVLKHTIKQIIEE